MGELDGDGVDIVQLDAGRHIVHPDVVVLNGGRDRDVAGDATVGAQAQAGQRTFDRIPLQVLGVGAADVDADQIGARVCCGGLGVRAIEARPVGRAELEVFDASDIGREVDRHTLVQCGGADLIEHAEFVVVGPGADGLVRVDEGDLLQTGELRAVSAEPHGRPICRGGRGLLVRVVHGDAPQSAAADNVHEWIVGTGRGPRQQGRELGCVLTAWPVFAVLAVRVGPRPQQGHALGDGEGAGVEILARTRPDHTAVVAAIGIADDLRREGERDGRPGGDAGGNR